MYSNFLLGELSVTEAARTKLGRTPLDLVARHAINDHGNITALERKRNQIGMKRAGEIISRFPVDPTDPSKGHVIVKTDASWTSTTVKLEDEPCSPPSSPSHE